jgi:hypothetical protein
MKHINETTKTFKVFQALQTGAAITPAEASKRFGVKNLSAEVSRIRQHGFAVTATAAKPATALLLPNTNLVSQAASWLPLVTWP